MFDWFTWFMNLLNGIVGGAISGVILLYLILPRIGAKTATQTLKAAKNDPEIAPLIKKVQDILERLEPLVKQFKNLDLDKIQKDLKPLLETAKKIDPEAVADLIKTLRSLAKDVGEKITEKPANIPGPTPTE